MNIEDILALYDRDERIDIVYPRMRREEVPGLVRQVDPGGPGSCVLYTRLDEASVEAAIREQIDYFEGLGLGFEWKAYRHDTPPDLVERLVAAGFTPEPPDAILALDLRAGTPALLDEIPHDVRRISDPDLVADILSVQSEAWGESHGWLADRLADYLREIPDYASVYAVYEDGLPVCSGWILFPGRSSFASIWGGATRPAHRKRGYYTALLAARLREARERGMGYLTVDAGEMSRPILEKHGFRLLTYATECTWKAGRAAR